MTRSDLLDEDFHGSTGFQYATRFCETSQVAGTCNTAADEGWDVHQVVSVYRGSNQSSSVMLLLRRKIR